MPCDPPERSELTCKFRGLVEDAPKAGKPPLHNQKKRAPLQEPRLKFMGLHQNLWGPYQKPETGRDPDTAKFLEKGPTLGP